MLVVPYLAVVVTAQATADPYGQCELITLQATDIMTNGGRQLGGGIGFTGPSACDAGYSCTILKYGAIPKVCNDALTRRPANTITSAILEPGGQLPPL